MRETKPDRLDGQISTGRYSSVSEHWRELIRADEKRKTAVEAGELDAQIEAASAAVRDRFGK